MRKGRLLISVGLLLGLFDAHAGNATVPVGDVVKIVDFMRFEPATLTVAPGATVTWVNEDGPTT